MNKAFPICGYKVIAELPSEYGYRFLSGNNNTIGIIGDHPEKSPVLFVFNKDKGELSRVVFNE